MCNGRSLCSHTESHHRSSLRRPLRVYETWAGVAPWSVLFSSLAAALCTCSSKSGFCSCILHVKMGHALRVDWRSWWHVGDDAATDVSAAARVGLRILVRRAIYKNVRAVSPRYALHSPDIPPSFRI